MGQDYQNQNSLQYSIIGMKWNFNFSPLLVGLFVLVQLLIHYIPDLNKCWSLVHCYNLIDDSVTLRCILSTYKIELRYLHIAWSLFLPILRRMLKWKEKKQEITHSLPSVIRHDIFQLCLVVSFWKFSVFINIPTSPPPWELTCSFNTQDCKPVVAGESLLIQQFILEQWRGKAYFVCASRVPRITVCVHSSLT